jgi:hypothetical protein
LRKQYKHLKRSTQENLVQFNSWRSSVGEADKQSSAVLKAFLDAAEGPGVELNQNLYALDSTTIDLCLSLFPWAQFRQHKAAVKMHTRRSISYQSAVSAYF